jgi:exopolysaccharide production protein ExoZ
MVVFHHARGHGTQLFGWGEFGAAGVDIFFVISGYVMALTTCRPQQSAQAVGRLGLFRDFMIRRFIRIVPLYWLALLLAWRQELLQWQLSPDMLQDLLFLPRFHTQVSGHIWPKLVPGWTINAELFFYLIFGASFLVGRYRHAVVVLTLFMLMAAGLILAPEDAPGKFYTDPVLFEFGLGVTLYFVNRALPALPAWLALGMLLMSALLLVQENQGVHRLIADGLPAFFMVWSALHVCRHDRFPMLRSLGDASYSIYLFHFLFFGIPRRLVENFLPGQDMISMIISMLLHLVVSALLGMLVHRLLEKPLLLWMNRLYQGAPRQQDAVASEKGSVVAPIEKQEKSGYSLNDFHVIPTIRPAVSTSQAAGRSIVFRLMPAVPFQRVRPADVGDSVLLPW